MKYSLVYTRRAGKDIQGLEEKTKKRIAKTFYDIQKILLSTQKNLLIQGLETIDLGLEITE